MTPDLEALSREIAATSDAWIVQGVSGITPNGRIWWHAGRTWLDADDLPAIEDDFGGETHDVRPDLADSVTVNSLLGDGRVWEENGRWHAYISWVTGPRSAPSRTDAICRAWIAAHKENVNG